MNYEICVEGFHLEVEVTRCEYTPEAPSAFDSDWDRTGTLELEFCVIRATEYDDDGVKMAADPVEVGQLHSEAIERAIWFEIESRIKRMVRRS